MMRRAPRVRTAALVACLVACVAAAPPGPRVRLPAIREVTLKNGARLILAEKHDVPLIAFEGYLRGGSVLDPAGKEGLAALTAEMLRKGAGRRSAREIAAAVDGVGGELATGAGLEASWISGEFMARDQDLMIDLMRSILREPTFPDSELTKLREQTAEALQAMKDSPTDVIGDYAAAFLFGSHPYGRPVSGDDSTVAGIRREDVLAAYRSHFGGDRLILAVVGDFDSRAMEGKLRRAFESWGRATGTIPEVPAAGRVAGRRVLLVDKPDAVQAYFWIGNVGIAQTDPDRVAVDIANTAFGGRFTSMLNTALRIKTGLTYGARSRLARPVKPGSWAISSYTKTESTQRAIDLALETHEAFRDRGLDATVLRSATRYIQGQFPPGYETSEQVADALARLSFFGLPPSEITDYPARVGAIADTAALHRVVRRVYPPPEDLTFVLIGNADAIRPVARRYGTVHETSIQVPLLRAVREAAPSKAR